MIISRLNEIIMFRKVHHIFSLKLYCGYLYTRPCMINHILGLKQLWLQVNGHAWFHLHGIHLPVRNGAEGAKNSKWKYMSPVGFEPTPRHGTTRGTALQTARLRCLDENLAINLLLDSWIKLIKPLRDNTGQSDCGYIKHVLLNWLVRLSLPFLSQFRF